MSSCPFCGSPMSQAMKAYVVLEIAMLDAQDCGDCGFASAILDRMDRLWLELSDKEHERLNNEDG